jgi:predicted glycoside hydrolase/deacetylase ChbG (UPF0249 family)
MKAIINADDLGISIVVNDAIFELMAKGRVTSATVMANGAALEDAAMRAKQFPQCSFGVHLNASEFRPITSGLGLRTILDDSGCFAGNRLREIKITSELREALFGEWSAQVERVQAAGFRVSHFDSHHHMHTVPGVFPVLKRLQRKFGMRKVRITLNIYLNSAPAPLPRWLAKVVWNFCLRNYFQTKTTDGFASLEIFAKAAAELKGNFRSVELMVHPGGESFTEETKMLAGEWWRGLPVAIEPISYNEL